MQRGNKRFARAKQVASYLLCLRSKLLYREIAQKFGVTPSAVGQNVRKAVELIIKDREAERYLRLGY